MFPGTGALNTHIALTPDRADLAFEAFKHHPQCNNQRKTQQTHKPQTKHPILTVCLAVHVLQCQQSPEKGRQIQGNQQFGEQGVLILGSQGFTTTLLSQPHSSWEGTPLGISTPRVDGNNSKGHPRQPSVCSPSANTGDNRGRC